MRIGLIAGATEGPDGGTLDGMIQLARDAEASGFDSLWMANVFGLDAIGTMGLAGRETSRIGLGTAVTPTYPRHPTAIAQQALTSGAAAGGRFTLGIGLSHKIVIEDMLGFSYDKPARHMREYLSILAPLLRGETVSFAGEHYQVANVTLDFPGRQPVPLLVAALGPAMLRITGEMADGTVTWMTGPRTLESHIIPSIHKAASGAGKSDAQIVSGFPVVLTNEIDKAKQHIAKTLEVYGLLPSYRAMLDREGVEGPADLALVGDESALRKKMNDFENIGVTDFVGSVVAPDSDTMSRTIDFLAGEARA